jgi:hypothetical protein
MSLRLPMGMNVSFQAMTPRLETGRRLQPFSRWNSFMKETRASTPAFGKAL